MTGCVLLNVSLSLVTLVILVTVTLHTNNGQSTQKMPVSVLFSSLLTYLRHNLTTRYMEGIREDTAGKQIILPLCCVEHLGRMIKVNV